MKAIYRSLLPLLFFFIVALLLPGAVAAQNVVDDSTKVLYGPKTSRYRNEADIFRNIDTLYSPDTTAENFHNFDDLVFRGNNMYQDLGVLGSASKPLFFSLPTQIGVRYGITAFDLLAFNNKDVRYFNTRSPYSFINYNLAGKKRSDLEGGFFRNVLPNWNVGLDFKKISAQKTIGVTETDDPASDHVSIAFETNYISNNGRFIALANYKYMNHDAYETGGISPLDTDYKERTNSNGVKYLALQKDSLFRFEDEPVKLSKGTKGKDLRNNVHLYMQYALDTLRRNTQVFYSFDREMQINRFNDNAIKESALYNDTAVFKFLPILNSTYINHEVKYRNIEHRMGLKGDYRHFRYALWVRRRDFDYTGRFTAYHGIKAENYLGASINLAVNKKIYLENEGEIIPGRDFQLKSEMHAGNFIAGVQTMKYAPTMFQQDLTTNFQSWRNDFHFTFATRAYGNIHFGNDRFRLRLGGEYSTINGYIFMNSNSLPQQADAPIQVATGHTDVIFRIGSFKFDNSVNFAGTTGPNVIRMPRIFATLKWYYSKTFSNNAIRLHTGLNVRWKDSYFADNYNPTIQSFYIQNTDMSRDIKDQNQFIIQPYFIIDPFVDLGISDVVIYLKVMNATQGLGGDGYFTTPFYNGQQRTFSLGLIWHFYD
ncbi:MAG: putative porin [Bacteroidota bacterium]